MSQRQFVTRDVGRRQTDPSSSSSRFNTNRKYQRRGGNDLESITVSIHRNLSTGGPQRRRFEPQPIRSTQQTSPDEKWWRVSIPQAGSIGKDRVMSTLKANCLRQFQPFHVGKDKKKVQSKIIVKCFSSVFHRSRYEHGRFLCQ